MTRTWTNEVIRGRSAAEIGIRPEMFKHDRGACRLGKSVIAAPQRGLMNIQYQAESAFAAQGPMLLISVVDP